MNRTGLHAQEHSLKCELLCDSLRSFGTLRLKVNGWSMLPTLWPGDTVIVRPTNFSQITPGKIALFRRGDRFFVHRVLSKDDIQKEILSRGDAMPHTDPPFVSSELLGEVQFIVRNDKPMEPSRKMTWGRRAFAGLIRRSTSAARVAVMARHWYQSRRPREFSHPCQSLSTQVDEVSVVIDVGRMPIRVNSMHPGFLRILRDRYTGFVSDSREPAIDFDVEIVEPPRDDPDADVEVAYSGTGWNIARGDFRAEWEPASRRGRIRQTASPYAIDSVLRIVHSLVLAQQGGFLLHSASAIRNGRAFLFMGVSGAGKTTISSLAPANVDLLTDEISYVRPQNEQYIAFGTPFTGELAKVGENVSAPIAAAYLLCKGPENRIEPVERGEAARALLANTLFFANDQELVQAVFDSALHFVETVPVSKLTFVPDARVWELIA